MCNNYVKDKDLNIIVLPQKWMTAPPSLKFDWQTQQTQQK